MNTISHYPTETPGDPEQFKNVSFGTLASMAIAIDKSKDHIRKMLQGFLILEASDYLFYESLIFRFETHQESLKQINHELTERVAGVLEDGYWQNWLIAE